MRSTLAIACALALAVPLVSLAPPAKADSNNGLLGQAQRFLNNGQNNDRDAYERGREDELRRQQAERDRNDYRWQRGRDWSRTEPGYQDRYSNQGPDKYNGGGEGAR